MVFLVLLVPLLPVQSARTDGRGACPRVGCRSSWRTMLLLLLLHIMVKCSVVSFGAFGVFGAFGKQCFFDHRGSVGKKQRGVDTIAKY